MNTNYEFAIQRIAQAFAVETQHGVENKYLQLYRAVKSCIKNKQLPNNWVVPSTRTLAEALSLSRTTIIKTYELLLLEKLISARAGSGYRVNVKEVDQTISEPEHTVSADAYPDVSEKGNAFLSNIKILNRQKETAIAFMPGLPPIDIFPINRWKNLLNNYWRYVKSSDLSYGQSTGSDLLKDQICNYLNISRNIKCDPEQIVVVSGSLQSIYLIASAFINKGDAVALEDPTFPNVHSIFKSYLAKLLPIPVNEEGVDLQALENVSNNLPKLIHVTPSDHYPTGVKMSLQRRLDLISWASKNKCLIIENDYEHEIGNLKNSTPSIYSLDNEDRTFYLGTFNRLLYPSIRLGYMVVPKHLIGLMEALQEHSHRFVSPSVQLVMGQFIEKNYLFQHLKNLVEVAQERELIFRKHFQEENKLLHIQESGFNSLHLVADFKRPTSVNEEKKLLEVLTKNQIAAFSLSKCYINLEPKPGLILGFSTVRPAVIKQKLKQMIHLFNY